MNKEPPRDEPTPLREHPSLRAWHQGLLQVADFGLASVIFIAPLFLGGRHPVGRFVFVLLVCLVALAWTIRQCLEKRASWRLSGAELLLLAGLSLVLLQLAPLPTSVLSQISPTVVELLPLWTAEADPAACLGQWNQISLAPIATRGGLVMYVSYAMLFLIVVQRIRSLEDVERLLRWIALAAVGMATLGLAQFLLSNGKFLWIYEHVSRDTYRVVKGTFANQNHFAHFLALGVGPLVWWLHRLSAGQTRGSFSSGSRQGHPSRRLTSARTRAFGSPASRSGLLLDSHTLRLSLFVGLGILAVAGLSSFSRGGVIALAVAAATSVAILVRASLLGKRSLWAIAGMTAVVGIALLIHGYEPLAARLSTLRDSRSLDELSRGRHALWKAHANAIPHFALFGTGVGSHREIYPVYMKEHFNIEFTHGESGYMHSLLETGFTGLTCILLGIGLSLRWCMRIIRRRHGDSSSKHYLAAAAAILAGIVASVVHSFADFVWYIPACMSLTVILLACACRLDQLAMSPAETPSGDVVPPTGATRKRFPMFTGSTAWPRPVWMCVAATAFILCWGMLRDRIPPALASSHWEQYLSISRVSDAFLPDNENTVEQVQTMSRHLTRALEQYPDDPRANLRMAAMLLRQFAFDQKVAANPMDLSQIRDAALASRFPTRQAQDAWLDVAVGENRKLLDSALRHCRRGLQGCPLQGEGYIYLAELSFLSSPQSTAKEAYTAQAKEVRPHNGVVLYAIGNEAALAGDTTAAIESWKQAFHQDPEIQSLIIETYADTIPAEGFLSEFRPQLRGLSRLYSHYCRTQRREDACLIGNHYLKAVMREAQTAETSQTAATHWHTAQAIHKYLGNIHQAVECEKRAVALTPNAFDKRQRLAWLLLQCEKFDEAIEQFQWCLRRKPDDQQLLKQLSQANRQRLEQQSSSALNAIEQDPGYR